jgi:4,5-DOPA dioxygenase extradiol
MKYPTIFINHGGGPLPLLGRQPDLVEGMKNAVQKYLPKDPSSQPSAIVVISAHWESDPISITASSNPSLYYDYYGFPPESYEYKYPAPGSPELAQKIHDLLSNAGIESQLDYKRGFDHGVFVPLMIMYPQAQIPVVQVSLHPSLDAKTHIDIGRALSPLRNSNNDDDILILGSGYTFHNMNAFFNPSPTSIKASNDFNNWLKTTILGNDDDGNGNNDSEKAASNKKLSSFSSTSSMLDELTVWDKKAPGARIAHPREEHLLPLFVVAAAAAGGSGGDDDGSTKSTLIYDTTSATVCDADSEMLTQHAVTGYVFN